MLVLAALVPMRIFAADTPNLEGTWKLAHAQTLLVPADGGEIPFIPDARRQYEANKSAAAKGDYSFDSTMTRCSSPGLPRVMLTPNRLRIFQRPASVALMFEWNRLLRQIDMPGSLTHLRHSLDGAEEVDIGTMMGVTHGHWEGDTLVAESTHFSDGKLLDNLIPGSDQLALTEHIRLRDHDTLEDRITITDPDSFSRSWDTVLTYKRQPDETFPEDVCLNRRDAGSPPLPH
ncbi:MAG: hypothetical protein JWL65_7141 [Gammaproteobacteria bacterium]|nr:hypothetical protein [Gammaproteobacteria bacterium]